MEPEGQSKGNEPMARKCILSKAWCKSAKIAPTLQPVAVFDASAWPWLGGGQESSVLHCHV